SPGASGSRFAVLGTPTALLLASPLEAGVKPLVVLAAGAELAAIGGERPVAAGEQVAADVAVVDAGVMPGPSEGLAGHPTSPHAGAPWPAHRPRRTRRRRPRIGGPRSPPRPDAPGRRR